MLSFVFAPRGPLAARRLAAHWVVIAAAALTTLVAAAVGSALAVFAQALPQAVRHDLVVAPGNSLAAAGPFGTGDARSTTAALKSAIAGALPAVPFDFWAGTWSDPLGFVPGALPARPASVHAGTTPLLEAAALDDVTSHAVLVAGAWPTASRRRPRQQPRQQSAARSRPRCPPRARRCCTCAWGTCCGCRTATRARG